jgi:hypothetical protein
MCMVLMPRSGTFAATARSNPHWLSASRFRNSSAARLVSTHRMGQKIANGRARRASRLRSRPPGPRDSASSAAKKPARMKKAGMRNTWMKLTRASAKAVRCSSSQTLGMGCVV